MRLARRRLVLLAATVATVLAAGAGVLVAVGRGQAGDSADPVPRVTTTVHLQRGDEPKHQVHLSFVNHEPQPVLVETVQLASPDFELLPPDRHAYWLPANERIIVDLAAQYGRGVCGGAIPAAARPAETVVRLARTGGQPAEYRLPAPDPDHYLDRMLKEECQAQRIESAIEISLSGPWRPTTTPDGRPTVTATVTAQLKETAAIELTQMTGSVLYTVLSEQPLARLATPGSRAEVVVNLVNNRCDPHAVAEADSKQAYLFELWVGIDGAAPMAIELVPDETGKAALRGLIDRGCPPG